MAVVWRTGVSATERISVVWTLIHGRLEEWEAAIEGLEKKRGTKSHP
ncbi:MAG: hypothetical protein ACLQU5_36880 [Isosphaeraceae bacterium]